MTPILGIMASSISGSKIATGAFESIATATGTGSSGTITFSSIPSTYKHLQIRMMAKSSYAGGSNPLVWQAVIRPNADSAAANYTFHQLLGNGTSVVPDGAPSSAYNGVYVVSAANSNYSGYSNIYGVAIIDIHDYASTTKYKTVRALSGVNNNLTLASSQTISINSSVWLNTSAITSLTIFEGSSYNWLTGSTFALYGIKG
jgi:hypothetical protein